MDEQVEALDPGLERPVAQEANSCDGDTPTARRPRYPVEDLRALVVVYDSETDVPEEFVGRAANDGEASDAFVPLPTLVIDPVARFSLAESFLHEGEAADRGIVTGRRDGRSIIGPKRPETNLTGLQRRFRRCQPHTFTLPTTRPLMHP
jgi:hypothetical protein